MKRKPSTKSAKSMKNLPPRKTPVGGRRKEKITANHNETLLG